MFPLSENEPETVSVESIGPVTTRARARGHRFVVDKPNSSGGNDEGPMASEYWLAALASCHVTTAQKVAQKRKLEMSGVTIEAKQWFAGDLIERVHLDIAVHSSASQQEIDTVFRLTERICTISRATSVPIERSIRLLVA